MTFASVNIRIKICGISLPQHAEVAMSAGANYIGLNFYPPSHRSVSSRQAVKIVETIRLNDPQNQVTVVGLFVNQDHNVINQTVHESGIDIVQLHGDESADYSDMVEKPIITAIRVDSSNPEPAKQRINDWLNVARPPVAFLLDTHVSGRFGGTGTVGDWSTAADFARQYNVILAGGLHSGNVAQAIQQVMPYAVDVSSGVETSRQKDPIKIQQFIQAVHNSRVEA